MKKIHLLAMLLFTACVVPVSQAQESLFLKDPSKMCIRDRNVHGFRGRMTGLLSAAGTAVSYTHLDVYKRQGFVPADELV